MKNRVTIAISSLFSTFSLIILGRLTTSNVIGLFLAIILGAAFYAIHSWEKDAELFIEQKKRIRIGSGCLAFIFAILMLAGNYQEILALYENKLFQLITISSVAIGIFSLFYFSLKLLLLISCHYYYKDRNNGALLLDSSILARDKTRQNKKFLQFKNKRNKAIFLIGCFIILILCWLPYLLMNYPGVMTPDSLWQYEQVVGIKPYSNHHPWIHTLLFKLFYSIGIQLTNNTIHAIAFYTIAQMILLAAIEIYVLKIMVERNASKWLVGGALFFYALMPYNALFAVTIWKDILFSGFVLLFVTCSYQMVEAYQKEESLLEYKCPCFLGILAGIAMCLLR